MSAASAFLGQSSPARVAHSFRAVATQAIAHEIDVGVVFIGRPMALEIVEEGGPIGLEPMDLEIPQRKREAVVDADQRRSILGQPLDQPFGEVPLVI